MSAAGAWRVTSAVLLAGALWAAGSAGYIAAKATLAQLLLERAWQRSDGGINAVAPWPWADTLPVARLRLARSGSNLIVLAGASGRNLAFGPAHLTRTAWPGEGGATWIAGHRDTHFRALAELAVGDRLELERAGVVFRYRVSETAVVHQDAGADLDQGGFESLLLVTCYPFGALDPGTAWRYVVRALPEATPRAAVASR